MTIDLDSVIEAAQQATEPAQLELGGYYVTVVGGQLHKIDLTGDEYLDQPTRKRGNVRVRDVKSFTAYWEKHSDNDSEIYADRDRRVIVGVVDAHTAAAARWGGHRIHLELKHSDQFTTWNAKSGGYMTQAGFAEFLEEHRAAILTPPAADMLELAQHFHATNKVTFKSGHVLASGQRQLTYVEEVNASAGTRGQLTIPQSFELGLPVFDGADQADRVTARLRYRINDGQLAIGFTLDQVADVVAGAFEAVVTDLGENVLQPILRGAPAGA